MKLRISGSLKIRLKITTFILVLMPLIDDALFNQAK